MRKIVIVITSFIITSIFLFGVATFFSVREIHINGSKNLSGIHVYDSFFLPLLNTKEVEDSLYARNPTIKKIHVIKRYPHSLIIITEESSSIAELTLATGYFLLNDAGRVVQKSTNDEKKPEKLTRINYYQRLHGQEYSIGDEIDKVDLRLALAFLGKLKKLHIEIQEIDITSPNMIVLVNAEQRYLITIEKDIDLQFEEFKIVYERLLQKGEAYSQIDVRFEKPIITF